MQTGNRIPSGLAIIIILLVSATCILLCASLLGWFDVRTVFSRDKTILSLADYQPQAISPTAFQPALQSTQPTSPAPTATNNVLPTPTGAPAPSAVPNEGEIPASYYIDGIYGMPQLTTLDCEARSAVDWARYFGVMIDENEFIDQIPLSDDPESGFVGDINGAMGQLPPDGYGVYPPPVASVLRAYGLNAKAVKDFSFDDLRREISNDRPVIVWIVNLPFEIEVSSYTASNGNTVPVAPFEHTWMVTGYNLSTVTVVDSEWTYNVKLETFLERWAVFNNRAIIMQE